MDGELLAASLVSWQHLVCITWQRTWLEPQRDPKILVRNSMDNILLPGSEIESFCLPFDQHLFANLVKIPNFHAAANPGQKENCNSSHNCTNDQFKMYSTCRCENCWSTDKVQTGPKHQTTAHLERGKVRKVLGI